MSAQDGINIQRMYAEQWIELKLTRQWRRPQFRWKINNCKWLISLALSDARCLQSVGSLSRIGFCVTGVIWFMDFVAFWWNFGGVTTRIDSEKWSGYCVESIWYCLLLYRVIYWNIFNRDIEAKMSQLIFFQNPWKHFFPDSDPTHNYKNNHLKNYAGQVCSD